MKVRNYLMSGVLLFFSFFLFVSSASCATEQETTFTKNAFSGYEILSDDDLVIINNYLNDYYKDIDTLKIAVTSKYWYEKIFDKTNYYIIVYDFYHTNYYIGATHMFNILNKSTIPEIFCLNLETKAISLSDKSLNDLVEYSGSYGLNYYYEWLQDRFNYSDYVYSNMYLPLWFNKNGYLDRSQLPYMSFTDDNHSYVNIYFSESVTFNDRIQNNYDIYNYFVGEEAIIRSYVEFSLGNAVGKEIEYKVNYYFDDILNEELSYISTGKVGDIITIEPDKSLNGYVLSNDNNFSITLVSDGDNVINVYYVTSDVSEVIKDYSDINTEDSGFYFLLNYSDLKALFPSVNFSTFNQFEQFSLLVLINLFYLIFWSFVIWIVLKMVYKFFQWI